MKKQKILEFFQDFFIFYSKERIFDKKNEYNKKRKVLLEKRENK